MRTLSGWFTAGGATGGPSSPRRLRSGAAISGTVTPRPIVRVILCKAGFFRCFNCAPCIPFSQGSFTSNILHRIDEVYKNLADTRNNVQNSNTEAKFYFREQWFRCKGHLLNPQLNEPWYFLYKIFTDFRFAPLHKRSVTSLFKDLSGILFEIQIRPFDKSLRPASPQHHTNRKWWRRVFDLCSSEFKIFLI